MKQKWKRWMAALMAVLMVLPSFFAGGVSALAASPSAKLSCWNASARQVGEVPELKAGYDYDKVLYFMIDGHTGYCMNYELAAHNGQVMASGDTRRTPLTDQEALYLRFCLYYGFSTDVTGAPDADQRNRYIATQVLVWIIEKGLYGTAGADSAASRMCASAPDPAASFQYYADLKNKIDAGVRAEIPSFAASRISQAETHELKWNEADRRFETTLTDSNGVLSLFDLSLNGYGTSRNGNQLTIYSSEVHTDAVTGTFRSNSGVVEVDGSCVFWLTGSSRDQEIVSEVPNGDPLPAYIKVKTEDIGYGELYKKDEASGAGLAGAVYGIYSDSACTALVEQLTTDGNGYAKSGALPAGMYYLKEIKAPDRYVVDGTVYPLQVRAGQTAAVTATDKEQMGALTIYKEGEVLAGWSGSDFTYETRRLPGAAFQVTAGADIYRADGTKVYQKGDTVAENLVTGRDGSASLPGLHLGTYVVAETKSIDGYMIDRTPQTVVISCPDETVEVQSESASIYNRRQKASVSVTKKDSATKNPLAGGKYSLYAGTDIRTYDGALAVRKGTLLQTVTTGVDGTAAFSLDLPSENSYYVSESQAPSGYVRNEADIYSFRFDPLPETEGSASFSHAFANDRVTAKIHLYKRDKETKKVAPQGDASLSGAVYGLYAREAIVHPDGKSGVLYRAGDLVASITTDGSGEAEIRDLYLGKYYLKETKAPEGYLPDPEEHDVVCSYEGDRVPEVAGSVTSDEQVYKQPFQLIKILDNGEATEAPALAGAGFSAYLKSSLKVLADGSYDFAHAKKVVIGGGGETTLYTDEKGYLATQALPYGTYVVKETVVPHNMKEIRPFEVAITENHPEEPQIWRMFIDREFTAKLRIVKKDQKTGKTVLVPGAEFKIYDLDRKEYVTQYTTYPTKVKHTSFFTDGDGDLILPEPLIPGDYRIEEAAAPEGYVRNEEPVFVSVDTDTAYETDPDTYEAVITAECVDAPVTGELAIEKKGELLEAYRGGLFAGSEGKEFVYREGSLSGAEFEVYAAEDIYTADGQKDRSGERIRYYKKGELAGTLVTDESGRAVLSGLPLGTYLVKETKAPYGYVRNPEEWTVTFAYADDRTPVIKETLTVADDRQTLSLSVFKTDAETELPVSGAVFGLYAAEEIRDAEGNVLVEAGTLLEQAVSGSDGKAVFKKDYPLGQYYAEELQAPDGYASSEERITYDASYRGQETAAILLEAGLENAPTRVEFTKTDLASGEEISGAVLSVYDEEGNLIKTWTSETGKPHVIERLHVGKTYILKEESAPYGYLRAEEIRFTVSDTGEVQKVEMQDDVPTGTLLLSKSGEFLEAYRGGLFAGSEDKEFVYREGDLSGAEFEVYAAEDIYTNDGQKDENGERIPCYAEGELVAALVTDEAGRAALSDLPLGTYLVKEAKAPYGYVRNSEEWTVTFAYVDDRTAVIEKILAVADDRQKVSLSVVKTDAETELPVSGAVFGLYAAEEIRDAEGNVLVEADTLLERAVSGSDGKASFKKDYPLGQYYAEELRAPDGYASSEERITYDASYQGQETAAILLETRFENAPTKVAFTKTDLTSGEELSGATLSVYDEEGNLIETWTSRAGTPHVIERLHVGETYTMKEEFAPYGYLQAEEVRFTVSDTGETQKVEMQDAVPTGTILLNKDGEFLTDIHLAKGHWYDVIFQYFRKSLAGVTFEVYAVEDIISPDGLDTVLYRKDALVSEIVTNEKGIAVLEGLPLGRYYLIETKTLEGFVLNPEPIPADLSYIDQHTPVVYAGMAVTNERQKVRVTVTKTDAETGDLLEGAVFGLYAAEEMADGNGQVFVEPDDLIEKAVTGADGTCVFRSDLPLGRYYVKEIKAPAGYVRDGQVFELDAAYREGVDVIELEAAFENVPTKLQITKTDVTGDQELAGAVLSILDKDGAALETWTSGKEPHYIERIPAGDYILREETAPYGYRISADVSFTVEETGEIQEVSMKDELVKGRIVIRKTDAVTGDALAGAVFEIRDKDGRVLETLATGQEGYAESGELDIAVFADGAYKEDLLYLVAETEAPGGYLLDRTVHEVTLRYDGEAPERVEAVLELSNQPEIPEEPDYPKTGDTARPWFYAGLALAALAIGAAALKKRKD